MEPAPAQPPKKKRKKKSDTDSSGKPKNLVCTVCKERFVGVSFFFSKLMALVNKEACKDIFDFRLF